MKKLVVMLNAILLTSCSNMKTETRMISSVAKDVIISNLPEGTKVLLADKIFIPAKIKTYMFSDFGIRITYKMLASEIPMSDIRNEYKETCFISINTNNGKVIDASTTIELGEQIISPEQWDDELMPEGQKIVIYKVKNHEFITQFGCTANNIHKSLETLLKTDGFNKRIGITLPSSYKPAIVHRAVDPNDMELRFLPQKTTIVLAKDIPVMPGDKTIFFSNYRNETISNDVTEVNKQNLEFYKGTCFFTFKNKIQEKNVFTKDKTIELSRRFIFHKSKNDSSDVQVLMWETNNSQIKYFGCVTDNERQSVASWMKEYEYSFFPIF